MGFCIPTETDRRDRRRQDNYIHLLHTMEFRIFVVSMVFFLAPVSGSPFLWWFSHSPQVWREAVEQYKRDTGLQIDAISRIMLAKDNDGKEDSQVLEEIQQRLNESNKSDDDKTSENEETIRISWN